MNWKLSILDLTPILQDVTPRQALQQAVRLAQHAESWGYERYWTSEHHDMERLASSTPEILLAHIGAQTSRIRLGSGAILLPHYKPYKVAETFHLLATLYPGRIDLGIGRAPGGSAHATLAVSDRFLEQVGRMPQLLRELVELLDGRFRVEGELVTARPIPEESPELWMLGTNRKSAQYAAEHGAGYVFGQFMSEEQGTEIVKAYRDAFQPSSRNKAPRLILAVNVICADTDEEAHELAIKNLQPFRGRQLVGSIETIKEQLVTMRKELAVEEYMVVTTTADYTSRFRSYELLSQLL